MPLPREVRALHRPTHPRLPGLRSSIGNHAHAQVREPSFTSSVLSPSSGLILRTHQAIIQAHRTSSHSSQAPDLLLLYSATQSECLAQLIVLKSPSPALEASIAWGASNSGARPACSGPKPRGFRNEDGREAEGDLVRSSALQGGAIAVGHGQEDPPGQLRLRPQ